MRLPASTPRVAAALVALSLACAALLGVCGAASAHAALVAAEPADGTLLADAPAELRLTFNEPVSPLVLRLVAPDGSARVLADVALHDAELVIAAPSELGSGTHVLSWRVVSQDGHPVGGSVVFSVGRPSGDGWRPLAEQTDWPRRAAIWTARSALYAALFFGIGGAFFRAWIAAGNRGGRGVSAAVMILGLLAAPFALGLLGVDALDLPLGGLSRAIAWRTAWTTSFGATAVLACCALLAGLLADAVRRERPARALALAALLLAGAALAASGHAAAAPPQWLTRPAVFAHTAALVFWIGALPPLGLLLARSDPGATTALRRFSAAIPLALLVALAAGATLAVVQVGTPAALLATAYGRVLLVKLALVAALLALAVWNRWRLTRPAIAESRAAAGRLARNVAMETVLALAVFATVALWRFTPPPRALLAAAAQPAQIHIHTMPAMADLTVTPGRAGPVSATMVVMTGDFGPLDAQAVTLVLSDPRAGIEPIRKAATKPGDGTWRVDGLTIPVGGRWTVRIDILVSDFRMERLGGEIEIGP